MSNYPSYMSFIARQFSQVSHQNFLVEPQSSGQLSANRVMSFTLPTNTNLHLSRTRLLFSLSGAGAGTSHARIGDVKSIIDRIDIQMGGQSVSSGCANTAVLNKCIENMREVEADPVVSHSEYYRSISGLTLETFDEASEAYTTANNTQVFSIDLGAFFESMSPNMFPLALVPTCVVSIYLSGNPVVVSSVLGGDVEGGTKPVTTAGTGQATYTVDNYRLLTSAWSVDDGIYDEVIRARLSNEGELTAIFCDYEGFTDTYNGSTQVSSASSSLDRVIAVWRANGWDGIKAAQKIVGMNGKMLAGSQTGVLDQSDCRGAGYVTAGLNFPVPASTPTTLQTLPSISTQINNIRMPSFDARAGVQTYELVKEAFEVNKTQAKSLQEYLQNKFCVATKLNLPASNALKARSGLNLQGSNSTILIQNVGITSDATTNQPVYVFLESSKLLKIMAGKQLLVVS